MEDEVRCTDIVEWEKSAVIAARKRRAGITAGG